MKFNNILLLVTLICLGQLGFGQKVDLESIKSRYPNRSIVYLKYATELEFALVNDELVITRTINQRKILLDETSKQFEEEDIPYHGFSEITAIEAYSEIPNGRKYKKKRVENYEHHDVISDQVFHDDSKIVRFTYPEVKQGAICNVSYTQEIKDPIFVPGIYLADGVPLEHLEAKIIVQKGIKVNMEKHNLDDDPNIKRTESGDKIIYTIDLYEVPAISLENGGKSFSATVPHILFNVASYPTKNGEVSVMASIDDLYKRYVQFIGEINTETNDSFQTTVDSITINSTTEKEKVQNIFDWVKSNIRYVAFEEMYAGFIPSDPQAVLDKKFGDCKGMSSLIVTMLERAGIRGHYAWVGTRTLPYDYSTSCGTHIDNHMIALYFDEEGKTYYLDGTYEYLPFGLAPEGIQEKEVLVYLSDDEYKIIDTETTNCTDNKNIEECRLKIDGEKLVGQYVNILEGHEYTAYQNIFAKYNREKLEKRYSTYYAKGSNKSSLSNITVQDEDDRITTGFDIVISEYISRTSSDIFVNLNLDKVLETLVIPEHRETSIDMQRTFNYLKTYTLEIPEGYTIDYIPDDVRYDKNGHSISISYTVSDTEVIYNYDLCLDHLWIEKEKFDEWTEFVKFLKNNYRENIILTKK